MEPQHYVFPPAVAYKLNLCLFRLKSDDGFRGRYLENPAGAMTELGLDADVQAALTALDRDRLVARGAHPYLVFMAALRLRMAREPDTFEYF